MEVVDRHPDHALTGTFEGKPQLVGKTRLPGSVNPVDRDSSNASPRQALNVAYYLFE